MSEVITVSDAFRFETFVDVHGNIFNEYLSSVVARLSKRGRGIQSPARKRLRAFMKNIPRF